MHFVYLVLIAFLYGTSQYGMFVIWKFFLSTVSHLQF